MTWSIEDRLAAEHADTLKTERAKRSRKRTMITDDAPFRDTHPAAVLPPVDGTVMDRLRAACGEGHSAAFDVESHLSWVAAHVTRVRGCDPNP